jgi:hypothetical protein
MRVIEELGFPLQDKLKIVALQGDCLLRKQASPSGGKYVIEDAENAERACIRLVQHARTVHAHLALIPEMAIPRQSINNLIDAVLKSNDPLVVVGGLEGLSVDEYRTLVDEHRATLDIDHTCPGTYVNPMIVVVKTATTHAVHFRAKRFASGEENAGGPQLACGQGPFLILKLGQVPFVLVPLICAEFVWPGLANKLAEEAAGEIDVVAVLQRNNDIDRRYLGPVVHNAYQQNQQTLQTRFILVNQGLQSEQSDGACYVFVPPTSQQTPAFDQGRNELWLDGLTYKGFRVPDRTGCFWYAEVTHRAVTTGATRPPVCGGKVLEVLRPQNADMAGLAAGLMRTAAYSKYIETQEQMSDTEPKRLYRASLNPEERAYVLGDSSRDAANESFFTMTCGLSLKWSIVEQLVEGFVDTGALLSCGGDQVRIMPSGDGNCTVAGRPVAVFYAPDIDECLLGQFSAEKRLSGSPLPFGIVLLGVQAASRSPHAKSVTDVLQADRVGSASPELSDVPERVECSAAMIGLRDLYFCEPTELRPSLKEATAADARNRNAQFLPGVFA